MRKPMCLLLVLLLLTSCGIVNKESSPSPQNQQSANNNNGDSDIRQLTNDGATPANDNSDIATKDHLEQLAIRVPGVNGAHCVVMGNTAIVGIDVDGNLPRSRVGTIKYSVAEALRKDPAGLNALVTSDMDLSNRLAELSRHVGQGHPVSGFAAEMADIIGRILPQLPEDTKPQGDQ
ncbi:YhcN/YlaJ family sporulation lipoprotein [Paenibacillus wynnii]|uniref:YhcN/YlaJ family sporulation lipoprotein n=1 Tax=Paenibacillus wynnii TaxID=268407 RepID=UPI0027946774|nr:YhcN/YlaJ family sporulation lipoprotein [Paenibacillus wynnii]MDQ0192600.1 YhcN/YlaJ family sporulation lipoprotein [Paenibacillus wynnii]